MDVKVGPQRRLSTKELVLLNCGFGENPIESCLDLKEIKPVNTKGNQSWIFTGKTDFETEAPIFRPPDVKSWLTRKDPDAGKDWRQERKGWQRMRCLDGITDSMNMSLRKLWMMVKYRKVCCPTIHGVAKSRTWLRNWKTTTMYYYCYIHILQMRKGLSYLVSHTWLVSKNTVLNYHQQSLESCLLLFSQ